MATNHHIETKRTACGGRAKIKGHRIRVQDIAILHERYGCSPDEVLAHYPELTLAEVYAALSYYHDHQAEIRQQMGDDLETEDRTKKRVPSKLLKRLTT